MQLTEMNLNFQYNTHLVKVPLHCPHCGKAVEYTQKGRSYINYSDTQQIYLITLYAKCCNRNICCIYLHQMINSEVKIKLIGIYPETSDIYFSETILKISPDFIKLYKDSTYAYEKNMQDLAAMGYRKSLEILVKDYAINELGHPYEQVANKSLYDSISTYLPMQELINTADVVRILGNDKTHYKVKHSQYDVETLKQYLDLFIQLIETKYLIDHPPLSC